MSAAPGIKRFKVVEPKLAGGSLPAAAGWDWLAETSYKTVLDLRDASDDRQAAVAVAANKGFRYISLPISADKLDDAMVNRFYDELAMSGGRPLFFFDTEGTRAATLWYIKQIAVDHLDSSTAEKTAAEIGPSDPKFTLAAARYLDDLKSASAAVTSPQSPAASTQASPPAIPAPSAPAAASTNPAEPKSPLEPGAKAVELQQTTAVLGLPTQGQPSDPTAWRSYAALLMTGLTVPLAYVGRSALRFGHPWRASLPAPARSPSPALGVSGAER
jgi:protein tyrosine phosphatase (PTP) superfamily phosphohydrolase (DUF442 family)